MNKNKTLDSITIGFALFAMFFGAGNLIFPPYLGWQSGSNWFTGFLCYIFIDIGMGFLAMIAIAKSGKGSEGITEKLGSKISFILISLTSLCIGPFIAVPRIASITYEIGIIPNLGELNKSLCITVFFIIVWLLCIFQSKVVDIVGKVLAPIMFIALLIMVIKGIATPLGDIRANHDVAKVIQKGLLSGYQTMDMMAAVIFSITIISSIKQKGYSNQKQQLSLIIAGGCIATALLFVVYGGLTYIGASESMNLRKAMTQSELLIMVTKALMANGGLILLGIIVTIACLTTAIGLLTSISEFFAQKLHIRYEIFVTIFTLISWLIARFETATIIAIASPVLNIIYPVLIILIIFGIASDKVSPYVYKFTCAGAFITSVVLEIESLLKIRFIHNILPLSSLGFGWIIPAIIFGILGMIIQNIKHNK